jgi:hypothetical protein
MYGKRRHRWTFWFLVWFFGTLAVMVVGLVIEQLVAPSPPSPLSQIPTEPAASPSAPVTASAAASPSASGGSRLAGTVRVVSGKQQVNGVELGFPHSTVGAVSAADADVTEIFSTLDPDRAAAVMRMIADPSFTDGPQQAAEGSANARKYLGLPASGAFPPGASVQAEPTEYQTRGVSADSVTVLLLSDYVTTVSGQGTTTRIAVFPVAMRWAEGDWKVLQTPGTDYTNLNAEPDTPQAASLGWQQLEPAGS